QSAAGGVSRLADRGEPPGGTPGGGTDGGCGRGEGRPGPAMGGGAAVLQAVPWEVQGLIGAGQTTTPREWPTCTTTRMLDVFTSPASTPPRALALPASAP